MQRDPQPLAALPFEDVFLAAGFFVADELPDFFADDAVDVRADADFAAGFFAPGFFASDDFADEPAARVRDDDGVDFFAVLDAVELFAVDELFFGAALRPGEGSLLRASETTSPTALPAFPMMSTLCLPAVRSANGDTSRR